MIQPRTSLYANAYYLIAANVAIAIFGFAFWLIAARIYPASEVGLGSALLSAMGLISLLASLGLGFGLIRFLPEAGKNATKMMNTCMTITLGASFIAGVIFIAGINMWSPALSFLVSNPIYILIFLLCSTIWAVPGLLNNIFMAKLSGKYYFVNTVIMSFCKIPLVWLLVGVSGALAIFCSAGIGMGASIIIALIFLMPKLREGFHVMPGWNPETLSGFMKYTMGNYFSYLFSSAPGFILPLMVVNILSTTSNAYFYIAWAIANILFAVPTSIASSLMAEGSNAIDTLSLNTRKSLLFAFVILIPIILGIWLFGDKLLMIFGQAYSQDGKVLLWILAATAIPLALNSLFFSVCRVRKQMNRAILLFSLIACIILLLAYPLMLSLSLVGAGVAFLIGQSVGSLISIGLMVYRR